jgi:Na(+)-translocating NADH:ubiquinone oxidoreductase F subunit
MQSLKIIHKWLTLIIGIQLALWLLSGLIFNLLDPEKVNGKHLASPIAVQSLARETPFLAHAVISSRYLQESVIEIQLATRLNKAVYRVALADRVELLDAESGEKITISETTARAIAEQNYAGDPTLIHSINRLDAPSLEIRRHQGPAWQVNFRDENNTSLYISAEDGQLLERRNDTWRLFDFFWMLHIMDYQGRQNFNNTLVIFVGFFSLWLVVSGFILLFGSFTWRDFNLVAKLRGSQVSVTLYDSAGSRLRELQLSAGINLFDGLAKQDMALPSNCGGGGSCGLCQVRLMTDTPVTNSDKTLISTERLNQGYRLACQQRVDKPTSLELSEELLAASHFTASVSESHFVTPSIKEIHLQLEGKEFNFAAGSYVQVLIPPHELRLQDIDVPERYISSWSDRLSQASKETTKPLWRAYSLANRPCETGGDIVLNVRIQPPPQGQTDIPAGQGSLFMFSLQPGDKVQLAGPYGSFHAKPSEREMVIIGGGAGMAPLRSIIMDQLENVQTSRKISFWYGVRNRQEIYNQTLFNLLATENENFNWQLALSDPQAEDNWRGKTGFIHQVLLDDYLKTHAEIDKCEFYICGPPLMLQATIAMLKELGVTDEAIAFDDFGV